MIHQSMKVLLLLSAMAHAGDAFLSIEIVKKHFHSSNNLNEAISYWISEAFDEHTHSSLSSFVNFETISNYSSDKWTLTLTPD